MGDNNMSTQFVFMLHGRNDPDDLDKRLVDLDSRPSIMAAQSFLSGPFLCLAELIKSLVVAQAVRYITYELHTVLTRNCTKDVICPS